MWVSIDRWSPHPDSHVHTFITITATGPARGLFIRMQPSQQPPPKQRQQRHRRLLRRSTSVLGPSMHGLALLLLLLVAVMVAGGAAVGHAFQIPQGVSGGVRAARRGGWVRMAVGVRREAAATAATTEAAKVRTE